MAITSIHRVASTNPFTLGAIPVASTVNMFQQPWIVWYTRRFSVNMARPWWGQCCGVKLVQPQPSSHVNLILADGNVSWFGKEWSSFGG